MPRRDVGPLMGGCWGSAVGRGWMWYISVAGRKLGARGGCCRVAAKVLNWMCGQVGWGMPGVGGGYPGPHRIFRRIGQCWAVVLGVWSGWGSSRVARGCPWMVSVAARGVGMGDLQVVPLRWRWIACKGDSLLYASVGRSLVGC